jgi:hypothetical protein
MGAKHSPAFFTLFSPTRKKQRKTLSNQINSYEVTDEKEHAAAAG